jgi:paraquat-inducible protein B
VRPRISLSSFSGLETLVSGAYIEMDAGEGAPAHSFVGLEEPPVVRADQPGTGFILDTARLGSIGPGTPVYYRSVKVGEILGYEFAPNGSDIRVHAFVNSPYDRLVYPRSRFWNESGITVSAGTQGIKFQMESLQAVLAGGIGFDTPAPVRVGAPAKDGTVFHLYPDRETVLEASFAQRVPFIVEFEGSVHGLEIGAPVEFRGIKVGNVTDIHLEFDPATGRVRIPVTLDFEPQRVERAGLAPSARSDLGRVMAAMNELVARGMRAQLRTASLLTGQLIVAFDFFPDAPPAKITFEGNIPKLPSVPSSTDSLATSASELLTRLSALVERVNKMPIEDVLKEAQSVMASYRALANAPELRQSLGALGKTLTDADQSLQRLNGLLASAQTGYGDNSEVRRQLVELLRGLQDTARSVKQLADTVEEHPESLIRGKGAP